VLAAVLSEVATAPSVGGQVPGLERRGGTQRTSKQRGFGSHAIRHAACTAGSAVRLLFDHGTLVLAEAPELAPGLPGVTWDPRVALHRAPARFHAELTRALRARQLSFRDETLSPQRRETGPWNAIELRPYQHAALVAWDLGERRGVAVLPTGSGKTRLALAALAATRAPALILVPTRALLRQWLGELERVYGGRVGCLGDGERSVEDLCVATFESAYRWMPRIGARFELLVVDEVHHFGAGIRDEALEMSLAPLRLGLTATPPPEPGAARIAELVGPVVYELGVGDLAGRWLADLDRVVLRLPLDPDERRRYAADTRLFRDVFLPFKRAEPEASWQEFTAFAGMSPEGRAALAAWRRRKRLLGMTRAKLRAVSELLRRHADNRVLVFTGDNAAAYELSRRELVMPITCDISRAERADALEAFRKGDLRALVSSRVLNEGLDVPDADVAVIVAGAFGEREYVQRVGRLLRPRPGKRAVVYELVSAATGEARDAGKRRRCLATRGTGATCG
jgi:superfamily II DNA or RNA helicase